MSFSNSDPVRTGAIFRISNPDLLRSPLPAHALKRSTASASFSQQSHAARWNTDSVNLPASTTNSPRWVDARGNTTSATPSIRKTKSPIRVKPRIATPQYQSPEDRNPWAADSTPRATPPLVRPTSVADIAKSTHRRQYLYETNTRFDELVRASPIPQIVKSMSSYGAHHPSMDQSTANNHTASSVGNARVESKTTPLSGQLHNTSSQQRSANRRARQFPLHDTPNERTTSTPSSNGDDAFFKKPLVTPSSSRRRHHAPTVDGGSPDLAPSAHATAASTPTTTARRHGDNASPANAAAVQRRPQTQHGAPDVALGTLMSMVQGDSDVTPSDVDDDAGRAHEPDNNNNDSIDDDNNNGPHSTEDDVPMTTDDDAVGGGAADADEEQNDTTTDDGNDPPPAASQTMPRARPASSRAKHATSSRTTAASKALAAAPSGSRQLSDWWIKLLTNGVWRAANV
eukprot:m.1485442 g.1485442  ORF g.1485442 m.1485442 type:complete len:457 (+) comp25182_c0_seq6:230-1600(+)